VPSYLNAIVPIRISQQLLEPRSVQHLSDQKFTGSVLGHADTLGTSVRRKLANLVWSHSIYLFNDVGAELLDGKSTNVARKLTDDRVTEAVIVEVQNVLDDLFDINQTCFQEAEIKRTHVVTVRILDECERVEGDLVDELHALMIGCVVNTSLQDATSVSVSGDFDTVGSNGIVDEL